MGQSAAALANSPPGVKVCQGGRPRMVAGETRPDVWYIRYLAKQICR